MSMRRTPFIGPFDHSQRSVSSDCDSVGLGLHTVVAIDCLCLCDALRHYQTISNPSLPCTTATPLQLRKFSYLTVAKGAVMSGRVNRTDIHRAYECRTDIHCPCLMLRSPSRCRVPTAAATISSTTEVRGDYKFLSIVSLRLPLVAGAYLEGAEPAPPPPKRSKH